MPNFIDITAFIFIAINIIIGYKRRFSGEIAYFISIVIAFVAGFILYNPLSIWLTNNSRISERASTALSYIATVVITLVLMAFIRIILKKLISVVIEEETDKWLGSLTGALRGALLVIIIFIAMNMIPHDYINRIFGEESLIGSQITKFLLNKERDNSAKRTLIKWTPDFNKKQPVVL